jgi:hypothetical protein
MGGTAWAPAKRPVRMRATYHRPHGIEHFLAFYDVHGDYLAGMFRSRRGLDEVCDAFRRLRACYPRRRLYVVLDNLHLVHDHPLFLNLLKRLHIHPVWTPTQASWLNLIEAQFGVLKQFTVANTDDTSHAQRHQRVASYLKYRHKRLGNANHPLRNLTTTRRVKLESH